MKKLVYVLLILFGGVVLAGILKFDYLASLPGYDVDGNYVGGVVSDFAEQNRSSSHYVHP